MLGLYYWNNWDVDVICKAWSAPTWAIWNFAVLLILFYGRFCLVAIQSKQTILLIKINAEFKVNTWPSRKFSCNNKWHHLCYCVWGKWTKYNRKLIKLTKQAFYHRTFTISYNTKIILLYCTDRPSRFNYLVSDVDTNSSNLTRPAYSRHSIKNLIKSILLINRGLIRREKVWHFKAGPGGHFWNLIMKELWSWNRLMKRSRGYLLYIR